MTDCKQAKHGVKVELSGGQFWKTLYRQGLPNNGMVRVRMFYSCGHVDMLSKGPRYASRPCGFEVSKCPTHRSVGDPRTDHSSPCNLL